MWVRFFSKKIGLFALVMVILMAWRGTVVAPVLMHWSCCSLALCHQCQYASCFIHMLPCSCRWLGVELWWFQCWCTGVAAVLHCAISVSTQVVLYICWHVIMVILMAWRGTVVAPVLMHWSCSSLGLGHQHQYASCYIHMLPCYHGYIDGLTWNCGSSSADALELPQSCVGSSVWVYKLFYTFISMVILMTWHGTVVATVLTYWSCCRLVLVH